jgi:hypothetical protein
MLYGYGEIYGVAMLYGYGEIYGVICVSAKMGEI